jgi:hypothetical protein
MKIVITFIVNNNHTNLKNKKYFVYFIINKILLYIFILI